jgi:transposase-like protein
MKYSKLSNYKIKKILRCFSLDLTAVQTSKLLGFDRNTVNRYYHIFRQAVQELAKLERKEFLQGEVEIDESYFGARRVRGKRGRGAAGKTPVFGVLKRDGKVFTQIVKNCGKDELMPIIQGKVLSETKIYTDGWKAYDGLVLNGYEHYRIFHDENEFARGKNHVNGIESFWSFAKTRLAKFRGSKNFSLQLLECEFRFNHRDDFEMLIQKFLKIS